MFGHGLDWVISGVFSKLIEAVGMEQQEASGQGARPGHRRRCGSELVGSRPWLLGSAASEPARPWACSERRFGAPGPATRAPSPRTAPRAALPGGPGFRDTGGYFVCFTRSFALLVPGWSGCVSTAWSRCHVSPSGCPEVVPGSHAMKFGVCSL